jgi:hypothetical protein
LDKNMQKFFFISIHKPPASIRFAPMKDTLAVTVEPFKFSPAEPVAYELSYWGIHLNPAHTICCGLDHRR